MTPSAQARRLQATAWALLRATHPGPCVVVTAIAVMLGLSGGLSTGDAALLGAAVLSGQFTVGWGNDLVDRDRDRATARTDKPLATGEVSTAAVRVATAAALVACALLSVSLGAEVAVLHLVAVGLGWSYNLGLKGTVGSPLPYAGAFGLLPVVVAAAAGGAAPAWVIAAAALLGAGSHFTNTLPDTERDLRTGVRGLPQRLGPRRSAVIGGVLLGVGAAVAGAGLAAFGRLGPLAVVALVVVAVLVTAVLVVGLRSATRLAFTLSMAASVALVLLLTAAGPLLG